MKIKLSREQKPESASALGASSSEVDKFFAIFDAVIAARAGSAVEEVETELAANLEAIQPTAPELYEHLDNDSKVFREELDRAKAVTKPLKRHQDRDDIVFDGIFMGVADRADFAGRFGPGYYLP